MTEHGKVLCLHRREGCWRSKALCFKSYEWVDLSPVPENLYKKFCRLCWPGGGGRSWRDLFRRWKASARI